MPVPIYLPHTHSSFHTHARLYLVNRMHAPCTIMHRYQLLRGRKARFIPGWDTHGLPIELKVLQALPGE